MSKNAFCNDKCVLLTGKFNELCYELVPYPKYLPDLSPCDFYQFPNLKKWVRGQRFGSNEVIIATTNGLKINYYLVGIEKLENQWPKVIDLK